jgi:hypothetical protein
MIDVTAVGRDDRQQDQALDQIPLVLPTDKIGRAQEELGRQPNRDAANRMISLGDGMTETRPVAFVWVWRS